MILIDRGGNYVTLWTAVAQMQLVTQSMAHSYRHAELWLHDYVRQATLM